MPLCRADPNGPPDDTFHSWHNSASQRFFPGCHRLALWSLTFPATPTVPRRKRSPLGRGDFAAAAERTWGLGADLCSEEPNDLQGKPGGFRILAICAGKDAGTCRMPDAASRCHWIVHHRGKIERDQHFRRLATYAGDLLCVLDVITRPSLHHNQLRPGATDLHGFFKQLARRVCWTARSNFFAYCVAGHRLSS